MSNKELDLKILSPSEAYLGTMNPDYVEIEEEHHIHGLRQIKIRHPIYDDNNKHLNYYTDLLLHGNKVWRSLTGEGTGCLYILNGDKTVDQRENHITIEGEEIITELNQAPPLLIQPTFPAAGGMQNGIEITHGFLHNLYNDYLNVRYILPNQHIRFHGLIGRFAFLREIEKQTGREFQMSYVLNNANRIQRNLDFVVKRGRTHTMPIEVGFNTKNIEFEETEADLGIAAAPIEIPTSENIKSIQNTFKTLIAFRDMQVNTNTPIPRMVTEYNNKWTNGPMVLPPYPKNSGSFVVRAAPNLSAGNYTQINNKHGQVYMPRINLFRTRENHQINIYWEAVSYINLNLHPQVKIETNIIDIGRLKGQSPIHYNTSDHVFLRVPGRKKIIKARIINTVKNPRKPETAKIEIGNYQLDFFRRGRDSWKPYIKQT